MSGSGTPDFLALLRENVRCKPDDPALGMVGARPLTYAELDDRITAVAERLYHNGFQPGDRMLFSIRPGVDAVVLILGTMAAGGTIVLVDPGVEPELFARRIELAEPAWAATESLLHLLSGPLHRVGRTLRLSLPAFGRLPLRHIHSGPRLPGTPAASIPLRELLDDAPVSADTGRSLAPPDTEALIVFTSGTTAAPKAVVHTRGSLGAGLAAISGCSSLGPGTHLHTDQLMMGLPALIAGAQWSMPRYPRLRTHIEPIEFARGLNAATHAFFTPADLTVVLTAVETGKLTAPAGLREIALGGAPVTTALLRRARKALPDCEFLAIYGRTEIMPVAINSGTAKLEFEGAGDPLGIPVHGVTADIADDGELILSGPNLCDGYLGELPMREIHTGDLARFDGDTLVLMGRKKDMLLRGETDI
ncbi:class I adenylate-forming enzyme family protein [Nocardia sp. SYP-A9097]|uniref:class I adenylate-forming enzyme family protein n=1 Tax=Nocardia sp. SYP-A9097 TaxID=2663237 RepID=UPI0028165340|nr:class I adenylate-forming enzyme family protein [Nocardia sp. SYP-A9097]